MGSGFFIRFTHDKPFIDEDGKLKAEFTVQVGESKMKFIAELNPNNFELINGEYKEKDGE